jgi:hypothetical protein
MEERVYDQKAAAPAEGDGRKIAARQYSRRLAVITSVGLGAIFAASLLYNPSGYRPDGSYFTICMFKNVTGLPCPGCGLTHSFCSMGKGDLASAFGYNQLGPLLFLFLLVLWVRSICVLAGWDSPVKAYDRVASRINLGLMMAIAFVLFGIGRIVVLLVSRQS